MANEAIKNLIFGM